MSDNNSVCISDFAGNYRLPGRWCDWYPDKQVVCFGGYWQDVPDMPATTEPTEEVCEAWAAQYEEQSARGYHTYLEQRCQEERQQQQQNQLSLEKIPEMD